MVTDRVCETQIARAAPRPGLCADRGSGDIFTGPARLIAHVFEAPNAVLEFGEADSPWVQFGSGLGPAAGVPVATAPLFDVEGIRLGEVRVLDREARALTAAQRLLLDELAALVVRNYQARIELLRRGLIERHRLAALELAANGAPLQQIFASLVRCVEYAMPNATCGFMIAREGRLFNVCAGPSVPAAFLAQIDGMEIGGDRGSCGAAAFFRETVIAADIKTDGRWDAYARSAAEASIEACWSTPIVDAERHVLGTLAIYRPYSGTPAAAELEFAHEAAHVASIAIEADNTRRRLEQMALHDPLTKLPNRALFEDRMAQAIAAAKRTGRGVAIGLMDLNRFKVVNDSLGHLAGDRLLCEVAGRLQRGVRSQDTVARMGGDEFLLLMTDVESADDARRLAERFTAMLEPSFVCAGKEIFVAGSMGVSLFPADAQEPSELLRLADSAMYAAKASGERIGFYMPAAHEPSFDRLEIGSSLRGALEKNEFEIVYQPQIALDNGATVAAEALLRWRHPHLGLMGPERFMAIAEETGLTVALGTWVLQEACRFGRRWADAGGRGTVWVNVSPRQIEDPQFVRSVAAALAASGLPASQLWLEITETLIRRVPEDAAAKLTELRALGVRSALDDFGRGYSSLRSLKHLPVGALKIDAELLREVGREHAETDEAIVRAVLDIGRTLGLRIVAEGVETQLQRDFLRENGCTLGQGFYFSKPLAAEALLGRCVMP